MAGLALKSSKALLVGSQARPPHITMAMALHCGGRINALEGSWHVHSPATSVGLIQQRRNERPCKKSPRVKFKAKDIVLKYYAGKSEGQTDEQYLSKSIDIKSTSTNKLYSIYM